MAHHDPSTLFRQLFSNAALKNVVKKLFNDVSEEINSISTPFLRVDLEKLEETISSISTTLPDAEQLAIGSEGQDVLLNLKEVAYDIEDILLEAATQRLEKTVSGFTDLLPRINPWKPVKPCRDFASDLQLLLVELDQISAKLFFSHSVNLPDEVAAQNIIVGWEESKEQLIHCIVNPSTSMQHPIVINVTGPGGIGKTSMARMVCKDSRVSSSYDFIAWALYDGSLSYEDGLKKLTGEIQRSLKGQRSVKTQGISFGALEDELCSILQGRKFLLLVDDIKHELLSGWKEYLALLMVGAKGSTVILISWSSIEIRRSMTTFRLDGINKGEGWSLFKRYAAFDEDAEQSDSSLKIIGRSIVNKCGGSPLAIKTVASMLRFNKDICYWEQIHDSKLWGQGNKAWIAWCISLTRVPIELIPSFIVIFTGFRPMSRTAMLSSVMTDTLIWFWMAQGVLQSTEASDNLTDIGHRYCNELVSMSNLLPNPRLADSCLFELEVTKGLSGVLIGHVNEHHLPLREIFMGTEDILQRCNTLKVSTTTHCKERTLWMPRSSSHYRPECVWDKPFMEGIISIWKHLRVLFLGDTKLVSLPKSIGKLKLLKYLSLCRNYILQVLPESICKLVNLQTLDLTACTRLKAIPRNMHKLVSMRHFILAWKFSSLPDKALKGWTSLHHFQICDSDRLTSLGEGIQNLTVLRTLKIHNCYSIVSLPNNINCLTGLKELSIHSCANLDLTGWEGLIRLRSLKSLCLGYLPKLLELPNGLQSASTSLEHLEVGSCENLRLTKWKGMHDLSSLKSIRFAYLPQLVDLPDVLQSAADSLRYLHISGCSNLRALPESLQLYTCLVEIFIQWCPKLLALPQGIHALKNLQLLKILQCPDLKKRCKRVAGEDWHLISHIPTIYLDDEVIRDTDTLSVQEHPGAHDLFPSSTEIISASDASTSEIIPATEEHSSTSYSYFDYPSSIFQCYTTVEPPGENAVDHSHLAHVKHSHPVRHHDVNIHVQPKIIDEAHSPDIDDSALKNQGSSSNKDLFTMQVIEQEKEMEGKRILLLFGEGYEFEKDMIIQLWMALELFMDEPTAEPMEIIGAHFFEKLVSEGFILCSVANYLYKVNTGKLYTEFDMVTERQKYVVLDHAGRNNVAPTKTLHVSVVCDKTDKAVFKILGSFNRLKTLLFLENYGSRLQQVPRDLFLCYESLLSLDISGTHITELPSSSNKMIHLRYLDLSWTLIKQLPDSIDRFKKLQTLKLKGCSHLHSLPTETKGLTELRHLDLDVLGQLAAFPKGIGALVNLRTLSAFPIGTKEGLQITELEHLNNLTGEFCIANLENVGFADEARVASLAAKRSIKILELRWSDHQFQKPRNEDEHILKNLCPHSDLEEIQILCYPGTSFAEWIANISFSKLCSITLFRSEHVSLLPSLGNLPSLKTLKLVGLNNVAKMDFRGELDHFAFPMLQKLAIDEMSSLEGWEEAQEGDYPCLTELIIKNCPNLPEVPYLFYRTSLKQLELSGCDKLAFVSKEELSCSLQQLIVEDCLLIKERCSGNEGQDWHKIYHVPNIWIDQEACETYPEDSDVSEEYADEWTA